MKDVWFSRVGNKVRINWEDQSTENRGWEEFTVKEFENLMQSGRSLQEHPSYKDTSDGNSHLRLV